MIKSYNELPVGKYLEIRELAKKEMDDIEMQVAVISILADMSEDEVLDLPIEKYSEYVRDSNFLLSAPQQKAECPSSLVIGGKKYKVMKNMKEFKTSQYIDYQTYIKMDDPDGKMAEILSIFVIPEGKKYAEDYDIAEVIEDIREYLPITVAFNLCFFFRQKQAKYIYRMLIYLGLMMKIWKRKAMTEEQRRMLAEAETQMSQLRALYGNGDGFIV